VLDPFAGSESTYVAAALVHHLFFGIELEPQYCGLARKRLAGVERYLGIAKAAWRPEFHVAGGTYAAGRSCVFFAACLTAPARAT
jgi:hypothetical protein